MKYFLDSNIIIDLLKNKPETQKKIIEISSDDTSELYINRLVYIECLRNIKYQDSKIFKQAVATLNIFEKLDINQAIYDEAIEISRYCQMNGVTLKGKCAVIDFIHFITAKHYNLNIISNDKDLEKIEEQYENLEMTRKLTINN